MIKHIILWQFRDELKEAEKEQLKSQIKQGLESLKGKEPGFTDIHVQTQCLPSSNADMMLDCTFKDEEALNSYAVYPQHVKIKNGLITPNVKTRVCIDYSI